MMIQKIRTMTVLVVMAMTTSMITPMVYAEHPKGDKHGKSSHGKKGYECKYGCKHGCKGGHKHGSAKRQKGLNDLVLNKLGFILMNEEKIKLTSDQKKKIKDLKVAAKKEKIRKKAEIDVIKVDIHSAMREDKVDTAAIHSLLDKKYEIKKSLAKSMINTFAEMKNTLSAKQMKSLKRIYHKGKKKK